jgi:hypothetical protein
LGVVSLLFLAAGCNDNSAALKMLIGPYSVTVDRADLAGQPNHTPDTDVMTIAIGKNQTMLLLFEAGIATDPGGPNPNGLIATLDGMNVKLDSQPADVDYSTGPYQGTLDGSGTIAPDGSSVSLDLKVVPSNLALPTGLTSFDYTITGAKMAM